MRIQCSHADCECTHNFSANKWRHDACMNCVLFYAIWLPFLHLYLSHAYIVIILFNFTLLSFTYIFIIQRRLHAYRDVCRVYSAFFAATTVWCHHRRYRCFCSWGMMLISLSLHVITFVGVSIFQFLTMSLSVFLLVCNPTISLQLYKRSNIVRVAMLYTNLRACLRLIVCLRMCACLLEMRHMYIQAQYNKCVFFQSAKALSQRSQCRRMQK